MASRMSLRAHPDVERRGESPGLSADTPDFAVTPDARDTPDMPDTTDSPDMLATNARRRADPIASDDTSDIADTPDTPSTNTRLAPPVRTRAATRMTPPTQATFPTRHPQNRVTLSRCPKRRLDFCVLASRRRSRVFVCSPVAAARSRARPLAQIRRCAIRHPAPGQSRPIRCIRPRQSLGVSSLICDRGGDRNSGGSRSCRALRNEATPLIQPPRTSFLAAHLRCGGL